MDNMFAGVAGVAGLVIALIVFSYGFKPAQQQDFDIDLLDDKKSKGKKKGKKGQLQQNNGHIVQGNTAKLKSKNKVNTPDNLTAKARKKTSESKSSPKVQENSTKKGNLKEKQGNNTIKPVTEKKPIKIQKDATKETSKPQKKSQKVEKTMPESQKEIKKSSKKTTESQKVHQSSPKPQKVLQNSTTKSKKEAKNAQNSTPKHQKETQKAQKETQKAQNSTPKSQKETQKAQKETQKAQNSTPKSQKEMQKAQNSTPKSQKETQKAQNSSPKPQKEASKVQKVTNKDQKGASTGQNASPKVNINQVNSPKITKGVKENSKSEVNKAEGDKTSLKKSKELNDKNKGGGDSDWTKVPKKKTTAVSKKASDLGKGSPERVISYNTGDSMLAAPKANEVHDPKTKPAKLTQVKSAEAPKLQGPVKIVSMNLSNKKALTNDEMLAKLHSQMSPDVLQHAAQISTKPIVSLRENNKTEKNHGGTIDGSEIARTKKKKSKSEGEVNKLNETNKQKVVKSKQKNAGPDDQNMQIAGQEKLEETKPKKKKSSSKANQGTNLINSNQADKLSLKENSAPAFNEIGDWQNAQPDRKKKKVRRD